jgi:hypothetical protein
MITAAAVAAVCGSLVGGFLAALTGAFVAPGDAGTAVALASLPLFTIIVAVPMFILGFPALLVLGIPLTLPFLRRIYAAPWVATLVGTTTGLFLGSVSSLLFFGPHAHPDLLFSSVLAGAVFGFSWIQAIRLICSGSQT